MDFNIEMNHFRFSSCRLSPLNFCIGHVEDHWVRPATSANFEHQRCLGEFWKQMSIKGSTSRFIDMSSILLQRQLLSTSYSGLPSPPPPSPKRPFVPFIFETTREHDKEPLSTFSIVSNEFGFIYMSTLSNIANFCLKWTLKRTFKMSKWQHICHTDEKLKAGNKKSTKND